MRTLYVSQNGMLENLGQSQVLPYLRGLARRGVEVDLLSFELRGADSEEIAALRDVLATQGIRWTALRRRRDPRLRVKVAESTKGVLRVLMRALERPPDIVHGRSYFPTAICDVVATVLPPARLLFDCRGMIGDEYVDAGHWTPDRLEYRLVKRYEAHAFRRAGGVVVLTDALRRWLHQEGLLGAEMPVETIPCCVDLEQFRFDDDARSRLRRELGLENRLVLVYSGTLGSWYSEPELARFAGMIRRRAPGPMAFLILTPSSHENLTELLEANGLSRQEIVVRRVKPADMSAYLSAGDVGLSFIKSCFSKMGSSPTKVAEYLACGLVVALNGDIGDQQDLAAERDACVVLDSLSETSLNEAATRTLSLLSSPMPQRLEAARRVAEARFCLERVGVARYERLYRAMLASR